MIGIHWNGTFVELLPYNGAVTWSVEPWGRWWLKARWALAAAQRPRLPAVAPSSAGGACTPAACMRAVCRAMLRRPRSLASAATPAGRPTGPG
jgi:hypothetical protein